MQALILAAGMSTRLLPLTIKKPKTLLKLDGEEILGRILNKIEISGINDIHMVIGHGANTIKGYIKKIKSKYPSLSFNFIFNPHYNQQGNIYSLYLANRIFNQDFILINSDVIFEKGILMRLINSHYSNALVVNDQKKLTTEAMKIIIDHNTNRIKRISKNINIAKANGEYIGIAKISKKINTDLISALKRQMVRNKLSYYEDGLQLLINQGTRFYKISTQGLPWMEIDTHQDLLRAKKLVTGF